MKDLYGDSGETFKKINTRSNFQKKNTRPYLLFILPCCEIIFPIHDDLIDFPLPRVSTSHTTWGVWKGIFCIRDLTKIRCEIRESARYLNGKGDITATRKNSSERLHLFVCMLGIREILRLGNGTDANQTDVRFFFSIVVVVFGKKRGIRKSDEKNSGKRDFREENAGNTGSDL